MFGSTTYEAKEYQEIQENLNRNLGPEFLSERVGPGNTKLKYLEGWRLGNLANEILGFNGWSHSIKNQTVDFVDFDNGKYSVGISTIVRVTLKDGSYHEDCGYGTIDNCRQKGAAFEKAKKESVTDGLKRTLKHFGNSLGNCVYSKNYLKQIGKMKHPNVPPLNSNSLYRDKHVYNPPVVQIRNEIKEPMQPVAPVPKTISVPLEQEHYGLSDDDDICLAADLECISADYLTGDQAIQSSVTIKMEHKPDTKGFSSSVTNDIPKSTAIPNKAFINNQPPLREFAAGTAMNARPFIRSASTPMAQSTAINKKSSSTVVPVKRQVESPEIPGFT